MVHEHTQNDTHLFVRLLKSVASKFPDLLGIKSENQKRLGNLYKISCRTKVSTSVHAEDMNLNAARRAC